jgi:hypothetical protein
MDGFDSEASRRIGSGFLVQPWQYICKQLIQILCMKAEQFGTAFLFICVVNFHYQIMDTGTV